MSGDDSWLRDLELDGDVVATAVKPADTAPTPDKPTEGSKPDISAKQQSNTSK